MSRPEKKVRTRLVTSGNEKKYYLDMEPRAMTLKELADRWNVSVSTVKKWLRPFEKEIGPRIGNIYSPHQVKIILEKLE